MDVTDALSLPPFLLLLYPVAGRGAPFLLYMSSGMDEKAIAFYPAATGAADATEAAGGGGRDNQCREPPLSMYMCVRSLFPSLFLSLFCILSSLLCLSRVFPFFFRARSRSGGTARRNTPRRAIALPLSVPQQRVREWGWEEEERKRGACHCMPTKQAKVRRDRADVTALGVADDTEELRERLYRDVEERRLKEWENYRRSHRADEDQNPNRAFIDITVGDALMGRLVVELFGSTTPTTVAHFRALVSGSYGVDAATKSKLDYLHCPVVNISAQQNVLVFGSTGGTSGAGHPLRDENFKHRHNERGLLTMMSRGPHTGGYPFGVTLGPAPAFDFHQVVFGRVVDGLPLLEKLQSLPTDNVGRPLSPTIISLCGVLTGERPPGTWDSSNPTSAAAPEDCVGEE